MKMAFGKIGLLLMVLALLTPLSGMAQETLEGLQRVADWTDFENSANDMPAQVWGNCDGIQADGVGIRVDFDDGVTSGSATYGNMALKWNTDNDIDGPFEDLEVGPATGFLASCPELHFLYNDGVTLPMAWNDCSMIYANNFDLDYEEDFGSNFRADTNGWVSARFQTYCGDSLAAQSIPAVSRAGWLLIGAMMALFGLLRLRARKQIT